MLTEPKEILRAFPNRKTAGQFETFLSAVHSYITSLEYSCEIGKTWLQVGDPKTAIYLLTADNDDSAIMTFLEILRSLPENRRSRVCFVLLGGTPFCLRRYYRAHPESLERFALHLGNVGHGDKLRFFPTKQLKEDKRKLTSLYKACGYFGKKNLLVQESSCLPWYYPAPCAVSICSLGKGKKETYANRCTEKTNIWEETNINLLRAGLVSFITCTE